MTCISCNIKLCIWNRLYTEGVYRVEIVTQWGVHHTIFFSVANLFHILSFSDYCFRGTAATVLGETPSIWFIQMQQTLLKSKAIYTSKVPVPYYCRRTPNTLSNLTSRSENVLNQSPQKDFWMTCFSCYTASPSFPSSSPPSPWTPCCFCSAVSCGCEAPLWTCPVHLICWYRHGARALICMCKYHPSRV